MSTECVEVNGINPRVGKPDKGESGLTRRAYLNAVAQLLDYGVKVGVNLVLTPFMVSTLGSSLFGVWQILVRLLGYMSAGDGRPTQALKWLIANRQSDTDVAAKQQYIGNALGVWLLFLPLLCLSGAVLSWFAPFIAGVTSDAFALVRFTCAILVLNVVLHGFVILPEAVLRGMNLGYRRMGCVASLNIVGGLLTGGVLLAGWGLLGVAGVQVVVTVITGVLFWFVVKQNVPWFGFVMPTLAGGSSFMGLSIWYFAWTIVNKLMLRSDVVLLGLLASPLVVTTYTLTSYASMTLLSIISMVLAAITPGLGGVIGQKNWEKARRLRREMQLMSWLLLTVIGCAIAAWNRSFVHLWVGLDHYAGAVANVLIVILMAQFVFIRSDAYVIDVTLQLRQKVAVGAGASAVSIALAAVLIPKFGIAGLCVGLLGGRLVLNVVYPWIIDAYLGETTTAGMHKAIRPAMATCVLLAASAYLGEQILASSWLHWLIGVSGSLVPITIIAVLGGMSAENREILVDRVRALRIGGFKPRLRSAV